MLYYWKEIQHTGKVNNFRVIDLLITLRYNLFIAGLEAKKDKDSRIKLNKIMDYVKTLSEYGTRAGEPYIKHIDGDIWELRPLRDRILFAAWDGSGFVLLHVFIKRTQKTPQKEIERAKRNLTDYRGRKHHEDE